MARRALSCSIVFTLCLGFSAAGHPLFVPVDPAIALVQADPGRTTVTWTVSSVGWTTTLARSVSQVCDVVAVIGSGAPPALRVRSLVFPSLFPLETAVEIGWRRLAVLGALHLGPTCLVGDRTWGDNAGTRLALHAADPHFAIAAGVEIRGGQGLFVSATWFPDAAPLWSVSGVVTLSGLRLTIGGTW
jgi:hypothetical protein